MTYPQEWQCPLHFLPPEVKRRVRKTITSKEFNGLVIRSNLCFRCNSPGTGKDGTIWSNYEAVLDCEGKFELKLAHPEDKRDFFILRIYSYKNNRFTIVDKFSSRTLGPYLRREVGGKTPGPCLTHTHKEQLHKAADMINSKWNSTHGGVSQLIPGSEFKYREHKGVAEYVAAAVPKGEQLLLLKSKGMVYLQYCNLEILRVTALQGFVEAGSSPGGGCRKGFMHGSRTSGIVRRIGAFDLGYYKNLMDPDKCPKKIYLCEGYATAASVEMELLDEAKLSYTPANREKVAHVLDCAGLHNLVKVAELLPKTMEIIVVSDRSKKDDDSGNIAGLPNRAVACELLKHSNVAVVYPCFANAGDENLAISMGLTDANDYRLYCKKHNRRFIMKELKRDNV